MPSGKKRSRRGPGRQRKGRGMQVVTLGTRKYPTPATINLNRVVKMQFRNFITITSNGSGIVNGILPCSPLATLAAPFPVSAMFPEYAAYSALYANVKCVQFEATFYAATSDEVKGDTSIGMAISSNLQTATAPGSYSVIADNGDSQLWPSLLDTTASGRYHAFKHGRGLLWAASGTPVPDSNAYAGCPGGIGVYGSGYANSTLIATVTVVGTYLFKSRA
jgi:hypothetical protein